VPGEFRPQDILRVLQEHGVVYVVIGGIAATLHGSPHTTSDIDITPERGRKNLERLSAALDELHARIRVAGEPGGFPFSHNWESLQRMEVLNLTTDAGDLDLSFVPSGTRGYEDLRRDAVRIEVMGVPTTVASLADVIRSKEAAGRSKDQLTLPTLRRMLEAQRKKDQVSP
jgi:predicted nucleotidyltransferase